MENLDKEKLVKQTIEKVRPYIQADGGDVEFVKLEDDIVYVNVLGACVGCSALNETLKDGVGALILDEVPGIKDVRLIDDYDLPLYESIYQNGENKDEVK